MSALNRIVSGSSASMFGLAVNIVSQIALVPLFLAHWDQTTFGIWAAIQGFVTVMQLIDSGHQDFVGFECLRKPVDDLAWRSRILSSALPFSLLSGSTPLLLVGGMWVTGAFGLLFHGKGGGATIAAEAAAIYALSYLFAQCLSGLLGRVLSSIGEAPRMQWFTVFQYLLASVLQAGAVMAGKGVVGVVVVQSVVTVVANIAIDAHYLHRLHHLSVRLVRPDFRLGARNLVHSLGLTLGALIETLQLNGFRVVLVPLAGPGAVAQFATLRTVANTAQQGINTFVYPAVPELMRVASARNSAGTVAILGLLWLLAVILIAPCIVVLQFVAPLIYHSWTRGKIPWDGMTFALLSAAIVINGFGQPARAILRGNNLLRSQIVVSIVAGLILLGGTWLLVPRLGLLGAAIALAGAEAARTGLNIFWSHRWLVNASLHTPFRTMSITGIVVLACGGTVTAMARWPREAVVPALAFLIVWTLCLFLFWDALPEEIRAKLRPLLHRFGPRRHLASPIVRGLGGDSAADLDPRTESIDASA